MWIIIISSIAGILVLARLSLPFIVRKMANRKLNSLSGYRGEIEKIRISLFTGEVILKTVTIVKEDVATGATTPFCQLPLASIDFKWRPLLQKQFIAFISLESPQLVIEKSTKNVTSDKNKTEHVNELKAFMERGSPFSIQVSITNGTVHFDDRHSKTPLMMVLSDIQCTVSEFSNIVSSDGPLPAHVELKGSIYEGTVAIKLKVYPLARLLTFDLATEINAINLVLLNDLLRAAARIDVNSGTFRMSTKVSATSGEFNGYIQPSFSGLRLVGTEDKEDHFVNRLWEGFVALMIQALKNKSTDQVAAKIAISGKLDDPRINIVSAILTILKNGFIRSLRPSLEDVVDVDGIKSTFKKSRRFLKSKAKLFSATQK